MQWTKSGLRVDLAGLAQQERKPHTEAEVKDLMFWRDKPSIRSFEALSVAFLEYQHQRRHHDPSTIATGT